MAPRKYVHSLLLISELILLAALIILIVLGAKYFLSKKRELVWIGSKIYTIKQILKDNRNNIFPISEIVSFNNTKNLNLNYEYLLRHSNGNACDTNYKKCGILDTYGNIMCLTNEESCPINEIIVDTIEKNNEYLHRGYHSVNLSELPENYSLYYTNKSTDKEIVTNLTFNKDNPKYITTDNFIFDTKIYDKYVKDGYIISSSYYGEGTTSSGNYGGGIGNGGGYWRILEEIIYGNEKMSNYIYKKMSESKNIDKYYKNINNSNLYSKNYIGFETYDQMNTFMNIDLHHLYFRLFPNFLTYVFSIIGIIFIIFLIIFSIIRFCYIDRPGDTSDTCCVIVSKLIVAIVYLLIWIGNFIYFLYIYFKINKNDKFNIIKNINTDDFIKDYIDDIRERYKDKNYITTEIILFSISMFFFILAWIFKPIHQCCNKGPNNTNNNPDLSKISFNN